MYPGAISFYLRGNGIKNNKDIKKSIGDTENGQKIRIIMKNKKILSLKFYYNYHTFFYIEKLFNYPRLYR